jgi:tetratricopeptide (TPR) repeat protein
LIRWLLALVLVSGCVSGTANVPPGREAVSLLGKPLYRPELPPEVRAEREALLISARQAYESNPRSANAIIWLGRRTAYLGRYREAIEIFSRGARLHPQDPRFYRHRGHRYITTRQFDRAIADLDKAAELVAGQPDHVEPDGLPNARGIPTSTLHFNIWYHLGLAHYLRGDFPAAARAYAECMKVSANPDSLVATAHWYFMTLQRLGHTEEAGRLVEGISPNIEVIENDSYRQLVLMYKGLLSPEAVLEKAAAGLDRATIGYGVGNWNLYNGRQAEALAIFHKVIEGGEWPAFGYIAAEAELARVGVRTSRARRGGEAARLAMNFGIANRLRTRRGTPAAWPR